MAAITCSACHGKYADHFERCIHCNAPRGAAPSAPPPPAPAPAPAAVPAAPPAPSRPPAPVKPQCPLCGEAPGSASVRIEKREYQGSNWSGSRKKYLVRWVDVAGVCGGCGRKLQILRYVADVAVNVPFVLFFLLLIATDSKAFVWPLLIYALVVFKWSWGLGYLWADLFIYGGWLDSSLTAFEPPGDPGTTRFPAGLWHCLVRLGLLPGLCVLMVVIVGLFGHRSGDASSPEAKAAAHDLQTLSPGSKRAREVILEAKDLAVPVHPDTLLMMPDRVRSEDSFVFVAFNQPSELSPGTAYQIMSGTQALAAFLKTDGHPKDTIAVGGVNGWSISRDDAARISKTLPPAEPPASAPLRR